MSIIDAIAQLFTSGNDPMIFTTPNEQHALVKDVTKHLYAALNESINNESQSQRELEKIKDVVKNLQEKHSNNLIGMGYILKSLPIASLAVGSLAGMVTHILLQTEEDSALKESAIAFFATAFTVSTCVQNKLANALFKATAPRR